jgi:hypothetical protein
LQRGEADRVALLALVDAGTAQSSSTIAAKSVGGAEAARGRLPSAASSVSINSSSSPCITRCGDRLSTVNGPATRTRDLSS